MEFDLYIGEDGTVEHVYDDALADLFEGEGDAVTTRASHVEPFSGEAGRGWIADMRPVNGPVLFDTERSKGQPLCLPFATRAEALAAERRWLDDQMQQREV